MWFPPDTQTGQLINGVWEIDFPLSNNDREVVAITIKGPTNSSCDIYMDTTFIDTTARGDFNRAEYLTGLPMARGRILRLIWSTGAGTAPVATLFCRSGVSKLDQDLYGTQSIFGGY